MATIEPNAEYNRYLYRWQKVRDVIEGEDRLKEVDYSRWGYSYSNTCSTSITNAVRQAYLRDINPADSSDHNKARNVGYIKGARLFNASQRTLSGLMGMLFRSEPELPDNLPEQMEYLVDDANGSGVSIGQQARRVGDDVLQVGRGFLLVDMPVNTDGRTMTVADVNAGFRPSIKYYDAESIIDWNEGYVDGAMRLNLLVLREVILEFDDNDPLKIQREPVNYDYVWRLRDDGVTVTKIKEGETSGEEMPILYANNTPLDEIPGSFVGSTENTPQVDRLPLEALVNVNLGDYQESANMASSSFQFSAAMLYVADDKFMNASRSPDHDGGNLATGENSAFILGSGGAVGFAAPPENTLCSGMRESYKQEMISLGAQLVSEGGQAETAEAARIKAAADASVLDVISSNISAAYTKCLGICAKYLGINSEETYSYVLNRSFFESKLSPDELRALIEAWQSNAISKSVLDANMKKSKVIPEGTDIEEMNGEIDISPNGVELDG